MISVKAVNEFNQLTSKEATWRKVNNSLQAHEQTMENNGETRRWRWTATWRTSEFDQTDANMDRCSSIDIPSLSVKECDWADFRADDAD